MRLIPSQTNDLHQLITGQELPLTDFQIGERDGCVVIVRNASPTGFFFKVSDPPRGYTSCKFIVDMCPGSSTADERRYAGSWKHFSSSDSVLYMFAAWVTYVKREIAVAARPRDTSATPQWVREFRSPEVDALEQQKRSLQQQIDRLHRRLFVLWGTGESLNEAVAEIFTDLGFGASVTKTGVTYDVEVEVAPGQRLLLEITGIEGHLAKAKGGKIAQVVDTLLHHTKSGDRVGLIINAFRTTRPVDRRSPIITDDALRPIASLGANVMATTTLHEIWTLSHTDAEKARDRIRAFHAHAGGMFF